MELTEAQQAAQKALYDQIIKGLAASQGELYEGGFSTPNRRKREANRKKREKAVYRSEEMKAFKESFQRRFKMDPFDSKAFPCTDPDFSWNKAAQKLGFGSIKGALREADSASSFVQFLRAGVQNITIAAYQSVAVTYEDWVTTVASTKDTELYAPNHGVSFPREVPYSGKFPEVGVAALDIQLKNRLFGSIYGLEQNLLDDDQTGSFQQQAALMGEYLRVLQEVWIYGKLQSVANPMTYIHLEVPTSETKPSTEANYPWTSSSAPFIGGGFNQPTSFGALSQANIQSGIVALMEQLNLQGIRMAVTPSRLLISPHYVFDASVLLNSAYYPSGAAAAGNTGGAFAINPLKGILDLSVSRYMPDNTGNFVADSKAWFIVDDTKPWFVDQLRQGPAILQEAPNSGRSFDEKILRWRADMRMNADFIDPRFAWRGSDGSV